MTATNGNQAHKLRIIEPSETIAVETPIFLINGQPGICKTSLAFSAENVILLNYDTESALARAANRGRSINVQDTEQQEELQERAAEIFAPFSTVAIDPIGMCVNLMAEVVIKRNPKYGKGGSLTLQGYGQLKTDFKSWVTRLRSLRKNLLFVSHNKEDRNGSECYNRPDITGSSREEIIRLCDFVGFIFMDGKTRKIDFSPTESWFGKNPAQWPTLTIPEPAKARDFMAGLFRDGRAALSKASEASALVAQQVDDFRIVFSEYKTVQEFNTAVITIVKVLPDGVKQQVGKVLLDVAEKQGLKFDRERKVFVQPEPVATQGVF